MPNKSFELRRCWNYRKLNYRVYCIQFYLVLFRYDGMIVLFSLAVFDITDVFS